MAARAVSVSAHTNNEAAEVLLPMLLTLTTYSDTTRKRYLE